MATSRSTTTLSRRLQAAIDASGHEVNQIKQLQKCSRYRTFPVCSTTLDFGIIFQFEQKFEQPLALTAFSCTVMIPFTCITQEGDLRDRIRGTARHRKRRGWERICRIITYIHPNQLSEHCQSSLIQICSPSYDTAGPTRHEMIVLQSHTITAQSPPGPLTSNRSPTIICPLDQSSCGNAGQNFPMSSARRMSF